MNSIDLSPYLPECVLTLGALVVLMAGAAGPLRSARRVLSAAAIGALALSAALMDAQASAFTWYARFTIAAVGCLIVAAYWNDVDQEHPGEFLSSILFSLAGAMLVISAEDLVVLFLALEMVTLPAYLLISLGRRHVEAQEAGNKYFFLSILSAAVLLYGFSFLYGVTGTVRLTPSQPAVVRGAIANVYLARRALDEHIAKGRPVNDDRVGVKVGFGPDNLRFRYDVDLEAKQAAVRTAGDELARVADDIPTRVLLIMSEVRAGSRGGPALLIFGGVLAVIGLCFKLAAVPFHFYAPDVYQGSHHAVAGMLAFVPKAAGLFALFRFVLPGLGPLVGPAVASGGAAQAVGEAWFGLFWFLAVAGMTVGNVLALLQTNVKRMLAYSSIAHTGYLLVGIAAVVADPASRAETSVTRNGAAAALFYILVYGVMTLGAFAALALVRTSAGEPAESLDDLAGLSKRRPAAALAVAVFMFSLTGLPPTAGFLGKLSLFSSALAMPDPASPASVVAGPHYWLVILALLNSAVSAYYYLGVVGSMYLREPVGRVHLDRSAPLRFTVAVCALLSLFWGIVPQRPMGNAVAGAGALHKSDVVQTRPVGGPPSVEPVGR